MMENEKLKLIAEISNRAKENCVPIIVFDTHEDMKVCLEDMRVGAAVRAGFKQYDIPLEKVLMQ